MEDVTNVGGNALNFMFGPAIKAARGLGGLAIPEEGKDRVTSAMKDILFDPGPGVYSERIGEKTFTGEETPAARALKLALVTGAGTAAEVGTFMPKSIARFAQKQGAKAIDAVTKDVKTDYKMPQTVQLSGEQVRDIFQTGKLTSAEEQSAFGALGLSRDKLKDAIKNGVAFPIEKVTTISDKPWFAKVKESFGLKPTEPIVNSETMARDPIAGALPTPARKGAKLYSGVPLPEEMPKLPAIGEIKSEAVKPFVAPSAASAIESIFSKSLPDQPLITPAAASGIIPTDAVLPSQPGSAVTLQQIKPLESGKLSDVKKFYESEIVGTHKDVLGRDIEFKPEHFNHLIKFSEGDKFSTKRARMMPFIKQLIQDPDEIRGAEFFSTKYKNGEVYLREFYLPESKTKILLTTEFDGKKFSPVTSFEEPTSTQLQNIKNGKLVYERGAGLTSQPSSAIPARVVEDSIDRNLPQQDIRQGGISKPEESIPLQLPVVNPSPAALPAVPPVTTPEGQALFSPQQDYESILIDSPVDDTLPAEEESAYGKEDGLSVIEEYTRQLRRNGLTPSARALRQYKDAGFTPNQISKKIFEKGFAEFKGLKITTAYDAAEIFSFARNPLIEIFQVVYTAPDGRVIAHDVKSVGARNFYRPKHAEKFRYDIASSAKRLGATNVYLAHNHPAGNPKPSKEDMICSFGCPVVSY